MSKHEWTDAIPMSVWYPAQVRSRMETIDDYTETLAAMSQDPENEEGEETHVPLVAPDGQDCRASQETT